jgi:4-hydroxy-3-polyprenylbenzoate decarboxylase
MEKKKIIVGITGASGAIYGKLLLARIAGLAKQVERCDLIFSENAMAVWKYELGEDPPGVGGPLRGGVTPSGWGDPFGLEGRRYAPDNFFAPMASGSAGYDTMIVCPCTMGTIGRIAAGISSDLLSRAADVMLKERKTLVLVPREAPYSLVHLNNMKLLTEAGAIICPASPSFYSRPASLEELAMTLVDRVLSVAGFRLDTYRWGSGEAE